jgi:hypothetical protein
MKILIIGHKLHSHTHSYIFNGIYIALKYLNYEVNWIYDDIEINRIKKDNIFYDIIITELYYQKNIPIIKNCKYLIQEPFIELYNNQDYIELEYMNYLIKNININNIIIWRPYIIYFNNYFDYYIDKRGIKVIITTWGTDLLPHEINKNIENINNIKTSKISNFVGTPHDLLEKYKAKLKKENIEYKNYGGTFDINSKNNITIEENNILIQKSIISPSIQPLNQLKLNYIPCRIFKNISYGKMGITNNKIVNKLFDNKLIYSDNIDILVDKALLFEKRDDKYNIIKELMINVRDNYTYISILKFIFKNI